MFLDHFLEGIDLRGVHWIASFIGVLLCVYAMQKWSDGVIAGDDKFPWVNWTRRVALWMVALSLLWAMFYEGYHQAWQPWAPDLAIILAVDLFLGAGLVASYMRKRSLAPNRRMIRN